MSKIVFREILSEDKKSKVAIFSFSGQGDPAPALDHAVREYVGRKGFNEFIDANMDNPWVRVVIIGINELTQVSYDPTIHRA